MNALLTSTFFQSNVLSVGSPSTDQGTLTIAFTDNGSRTFTDADGPMDASYVRLGFDAPVDSKSIYTLESSGAKVGSLSHWNGLVVKGGTVQLGSDVVFKGAIGAASLALTGGALRLDDGAGTGHDLIFAGGADLRAGTIEGGPKGGLLTIMGNAVKTSSGTVNLNGRIAVTGSQGINIQAGTISQSASDLIASSTNMTLSGGTYQLVGGASQTLGTLTLTASSTIDFAGGASILAFADSSGASWASGAILSIINWQGSPISGGGSARLVFGGLTSSQLAQIKFIDPAGWTGTYDGIQLKSCEVVPVPEPSSVVAAIALGGLAGVFEWRRRRKRPLVTA